MPTRISDWLCQPCISILDSGQDILSVRDARKFWLDLFTPLCPAESHVGSTLPTSQHGRRNGQFGLTDSHHGSLHESVGALAWLPAHAYDSCRSIPQHEPPAFRALCRQCRCRRHVVARQSAMLDLSSPNEHLGTARQVCGRFAAAACRNLVFIQLRGRSSVG